MVLQVGVKAFIQNRQGEFLFLKRGKVYEGFEGEWTIPGGRITPGEPLHEALAREIKEETGLTLTGTPKLLFAQDIIRPPKMHVVRLTFLATVKGKLALDNTDHTEVKWMSIETLKGTTYDPLFDPVLKLLGRGGEN